MGQPLEHLKVKDRVQYKDSYIDNVIYDVEGVSWKSTGRGHVIDRVKIDGRWEMAGLLERPDDIST